MFQKIKIKINSELISTPGHVEYDRWEDDGGHLPDVIQMIDNSLIPLKPGDTFKVKSGHLTKENDQVYYEAVVELLKP